MGIPGGKAEKWETPETAWPGNSSKNSKLILKSAAFYALGFLRITEESTG